MKRNKYSSYGKTIAGDEMYNFAMDRYNDLLNEAEENRRYTPSEESGRSKKNRSTFQVFRQLLAQIF